MSRHTPKPYDRVTQLLETEGVDKFIESWNELQASNGKTRSRRTLFVALVSAACVLLLAGAAGLVAVLLVPPSGPVDLKGNAVGVDAASTPAPRIQKQMHAVSDVGSRFVVGSVGLNVPLGALSEAAGTITPPGFTSAYLVRNLGVGLADAKRGTVFVAMHAIRGGGTGPGNYLINVAKGTSRLAVGSTITVGNLTYDVTGSEALPKSGIQYASDVWANTPGRLVVLTCLEVPSGAPSVDNMVIFAALEPKAS